MALDAMTARVDLPAPLIPVRTIEASDPNFLTEAKSEPGRGELGAEREAVSRLGGSPSSMAEQYGGIPLTEELLEGRDEG